MSTVNSSQSREDEKLLQGSKKVSPSDSRLSGVAGGAEMENTDVVGGGNCNAILKGMPAHVQDLLVEVDLVGVGFLLHSASGPGRAARS